MGRRPGSKNKPKDQTMPTKTADKPAAVADQAASKGEVAIFSPPRLPYHPKVEEAFGIDRGAWKVLVEAIFPAAKTVDAIVMALSYCKSRGLDVMKRPVHIVPMWDSARGAMIESVWPGISELRTTASRTSGYAGCDEAQFGPNVTMTFKGRVKDRGEWTEKNLELEFPEWCRITVYRIVAGQKCKFVGPKVKWLETYATQGASELPNKMWEGRAEGQIEKCAEAAALRRAFPEEIGNELTAEEMTGRGVQDLAVEIPAAADQTASAGDRDQAPPRSTAPEPGPNEDHAAGEVHDGAPPRRAPRAEPKEDPITSGPQPQRDTAAEDVKPHRIPGTGLNADQWAEKYLDLIKTSPDIATVYAWIDVNSKPYRLQGVSEPQAGPITRINAMNGKTSLAKKISDETKRLIEKIRDTKEKAEAKAAAKAKPTAAPPSEMGDEPTGDMDGPAEPGSDEFGAPADDNPETILRWIGDVLSQVDAPEDLENIWTAHCEPKIVDLMPPDKDEARGILRRHEKRLEP